MSTTRRTRIKICGITTVDAAAAAVGAGADAIGLISAAGSPRRIDLARAGVIAASVPPLVTVVAVHRDPQVELASAWAQVTDWTQLHGDEDETLIAAIGGRIIRGIPFDLEAIGRWNRCAGVHALLIDGPGGGSGTGFDHHQLAAAMPSIEKPVILAGGLTPENVAEAVSTVHPFGVDISSGVESAPGVKDPARIAAFCAAVRRADAGGG